MRTVQGYLVSDVSSVHVVSVKEGKAIRLRDPKADKHRLKYGYKPYVNPETYTPEERKFMEE